MEGLKLESLGKGRFGALLVDPIGDMIPIVRSSAKYSLNPARFNSTHRALADAIGIKTNNAMFETYETTYQTMGFHTDSSIDLEYDSHIAIFSFYSDPSLPPRELVIQEKLTGVTTTILLKHNSAVVFSLDTNKKHVHKIIGTSPWSGITFRQSKTYIRFIEDIPYFADGKRLHLATRDEAKNFYYNKGKENTEIEHTYPDFDFTLNPSDLLAAI